MDADDLAANRAAASRSPRARSSITRSSSDSAKVTPAALIACRSTARAGTGARRRGCRGGVLARMSLSAPRRSPSAARSASAGTAVSQRSRMVAKAALTSNTPSARDRGDRGPRHVGPPNARRQRAGKAVARQASSLPSSPAIGMSVLPCWAVARIDGAALASLASSMLAGRGRWSEALTRGTLRIQRRERRTSE